ncbi:MAG: exo-beta-1,3-glucanase [Maioricimonas sp. JB049]
MKTALAALLFLTVAAVDGMAADVRFPLFRTLTSDDPPRLIAYTPSQLDPRDEANQRALPTTSIRADLEALRPVFDGLVLYGYHEACTPRIMAVAKDLNYRVVLLAIWDLRSSAEVDGCAREANLWKDHFDLGVIVGNEGITFDRYEREDLAIAGDRLRRQLHQAIPIGTSEPLQRSRDEFVQQFGDFMAPNIHPVFDRPDLSPAAAAAWAREQARALAQQAGKPVILKETGFPHGGKPQYSIESQQAFWQAFVEPGILDRSSNESWVYCGVAFEAFDLPWKQQASGLDVEDSWGLFTNDRTPLPALDAWKE